MRRRSWRWLRIRILGLLAVPPLIEPWTPRLQYATRLQNVLLPQPEAAKTAEN